MTLNLNKLEIPLNTMDNKTLDTTFEKVWAESHLPDALRSFCRQWYGKGAFEMHSLMTDQPPEEITPAIDLMTIEETKQIIMELPEGEWWYKTEIMAQEDQDGGSYVFIDASDLKALVEAYDKLLEREKPPF